MESAVLDEHRSRGDRDVSKIAKGRAIGSTRLRSDAVAFETFGHFWRNLLGGLDVACAGLLFILA